MNDEVEETLRLISYNRKNAIIVGSQTNRQKAVKYKNDYDLFETIVFNKSKEQFIMDVHKLFIRMVKEIKKNKNIYFIEFKGGVYEPLYITDEDLLNKTRRLDFYKQAVEDGTISNDIFELIQGIKSKDELQYFCSNLYKVRWTIQDILNGDVILFNGKKFLFKDIFNMSSIIKIDVMLFNADEIRFIPFSNYFEFINKDKDMNISETDVKDSLKSEADELEKSGNYYKSIKRLYSLSLYNKDKKQAARYLKIINSTAGALYFIRGNIENCIEVLKIYKKKKTLEEVQSVIHNFYESHSFDKHIAGLFEKALMKHTHYGLLKAAVNLEVALNKAAQEQTKNQL